VAGKLTEPRVENVYHARDNWVVGLWSACFSCDNINTCKTIETVIEEKKNWSNPYTPPSLRLSSQWFGYERGLVQKRNPRRLRDVVLGLFFGFCWCWIWRIDRGRCEGCWFGSLYKTTGSSVGGDEWWLIFFTVSHYFGLLEEAIRVVVEDGGSKLLWEAETL
jgi:hypothetical protein